MAEKKQYSQLQFGLDIRTISPVDRRLVLSYEEMSTGIYSQADENSGKDIILGNILPEYYIVLCKGFDDDTHPLYPILNEKFQGRLFVYEKTPRVPWNNSVDNEFYYRIKDELSGGIYTLLSYAVDIVGPDGGSLTDPERGLVTIHDPRGERIESAEARLDAAEQNIELLYNNKVDSENVEHVVDEKLEKYQKLMPIYGDGDELDDSEGVPHRRPGTAGFGVHVEYEPVTGKPWKTQAKISHEAVVPAGGWLSKYDIGGVAAGQAFMEGTSIEEVLRQLFCGDPKMDNVICFAMDSRKPTALNVWTDFHWLQEPTKRDVLLTRGIDHEYNPSNQFILMALPIAMINQHGADYDTEWPIVLKELYNKDAEQFTYPFTYVDVKINATAADIGYRIYFLVGDDPVSGPQNIHFEFMENPDYPRP